MKTTKAT